jgi:hypothetical protein
MPFALCALLLLALDSAFGNPCLREAASAKAGAFGNWYGQLFYG